MQKSDNELVVDLEAISKARIRNRWYRAATTILLGIALITGNEALVYRHKHSSLTPPNQITISGYSGYMTTAGTFVYNEGNIQPTVPVSDAQLIRGLDDAVAEWSRALGRKVKRPALLLDSPNGCAADYGGGLIACANRETYSIIVRAIYYADAKTIMMHELGHLLEVPHIDGDGLMNPVYGGPLDHPSPYAVAIAKEALRLCENEVGQQKAAR